MRLPVLANALAEQLKDSSAPVRRDFGRQSRTGTKR